MGKFYGQGRCPERRCLSLCDWPSADKQLWENALMSGDPLDGDGVRSKYRPISNRKTERGYGRWLTFLEQKGWFSDCAPADRIHDRAVVAYVQEMRELENSSYTILARLQELHEGAKVMDPGRDWAWMKRIASRVRATAKPVRNKAAKIVSWDDLFTLGLELMKGALSEQPPLSAALMFRDGLLISLIAFRPMRRKNLTSITLGKHLVKRAGVWWLRFSGEEMKNDDPVEMPWPDELTSALETWLSRWRPILCQRRGRWARSIEDALWVSAHGSPLSQDGIYGRVVFRTQRAFGHAVNPHLSRDIVATHLADIDPGRVRIAAALLSHRNFATTERYYLHGQRVQATRKYQEAILRRRRRRKG